MHDLEESKDLVKTAIRYISSFELEALNELLADDVVWWVIGGTQDGEYFHGKKAALALITGLRDRLAEAKIRMDVLGMTAEADRVAVEIKSYGRFKNGLEYRNTYHELFTIRAGRIASCKEYLDTKHLWDVGLRPRPIASAISPN